MVERNEYMCTGCASKCLAKCVQKPKFCLLMGANTDGLKINWFCISNLSPLEIADLIIRSYYE